MSKKAQEAARHEAAMKGAVDGAKRLFATHERDRKLAEHTDRTSSDAERFTQAREELRLKQELERYKEVFQDMAHVRRLALSEHDKHAQWERLVEVSWLPAPTSEADINAFLQNWRDEQEELSSVRPSDSVVTVKVRDRQIVESHWMRADQPTTKDSRRDVVDGQLNQCLLAVQLAESIQRESDAALLKAHHDVIERQRRFLIDVYQQILHTFEHSTGCILQYLDAFLEHPEEYLTRLVPARRNAAPLIKYGVYVGVADKERNRFNRISFQELSVSIDPKDTTSRQLPKNMTTRLPKTAVRVMQLNFDPLSILAPTHRGTQCYALDCVFIAELLQLPEKVKQVADWGCRLEAAGSALPTKEPYRPTGDGSRSDEWAVKLSFQVPENIVLRTRSPQIGKWIPEQAMWEPCASAVIVTEIGIRKVQFLAAELTTMALIQEKGFDVPYDSWQLYPVSDDEAMLVIDCKKRGEPSSDRQVRIQIREAQCRLVAPEDKELAALRSQWLNPATLIRLLGKSGFNFSLSDADAVPGITPKSTTMEAKGYQDIAAFCGVHAFGNSRHNKYGEDSDMTLFRMSKAQRPFGADRNWFSVTCEGDVDEWHSVRYEKHRCAIAQFREAEDDPTLSNAANKETHLNLFTLLEAEYGAESVQHRPMEGNQLLQTAVFQLLSIVRPFTWG